MEIIMKKIITHNLESDNFNLFYHYIKLNKKHLDKNIKIE